MTTGTLAARRTTGMARFDRRGAATWLLLGPCLLYLAAFAIYPLIYSLRLSFTDLTAADGTGRWVGLKNYGDLLVDPLFWNATMNSAIMVGIGGRDPGRARRGAGDVLQSASQGLGHRARHTGAADADHADHRRRDVAGAAEPGLGAGELGHHPAGLRGAELAGLDRDGDEDADHGRGLAMDALRLHHRLRPAAGLPLDVFEAAQLDGAGAFSTFRHVTLPLLMPAIVFAAVFRAVDAFRSFDLIYGLSYGGPARSTTTLSFFSFQNGFQFQNYGYAAAVAYMMLLILMVGTTVLLRYVQLRPGHAR